MAVTQNQYTGNGNTVLFSFTFPYLAATDVKVKINGVTQATTEYSLANATTIQMNSAPANGATVLVFRDTDNDNKQATFYPGSAIKAEDLNNNIDQILYTAQEVDNNSMSTTGDDPMTGDLNLGGNKATNMGAPTAGTDGVNKTTLDTSIDTALESDVLVGTDLSKSASGGQVTISHNVSGANTTINNANGNVIQDITVSAQGHVTSVGSKNLDQRYYTETELDAGQLDNRYFTETELSGGQLNNLYYTETELDGGQLDNRYYTETELNNGQLDTRYHTKSELNTGALDARYFRQDSSETITSGATWSGSDNFIATTGAIDARIIDLVDDVGGFVPIANETSFPATNPDVNNGAGTLVSIKTISSARTPSGGSVVITDGAGSGNDVTITGLGTTVLPAGYGVIVETTGTTHTYTFHRLSPDATSVTAVSSIPTEIATVAGISTHVQTVSGINNDVQVVGANSSSVTSVAGSIASVNTTASNLDQIQNFANVYRIVSSDPTTSLNAGDLIFNTTTNKFKVYTGSAWVDAVARQFSDNTRMEFGDSNDLGIYHDGSNSRIVDTGTGDFIISSNQLQINNAANTEVQAKFIQNGAVELYHDNSKKFETTSTGVTITGALSSDGISVGDNEEILLGAGNDLKFRHDGTDNHIVSANGDINIQVANGEDAIVAKPNGAVELYYDNTKRFETTSTGVKTQGEFSFRGSGDVEKILFAPGNDHLTFINDVKIKFGTGAPLQIYSGSSDSFIVNDNGPLYIKADSTRDGIQINNNGKVALFYQGNEKFKTANDGAEVLGILYPETNDTYTLGKSAKRFSTAYAIDGNFSGDITVSGTVDGRDLATDGTKLDGIETGATADQTKSDIDALNIAASTAATLANSRTIAGSSFDGSANIDISYTGLTNKPSIPTNTNQLTNGAGFTTNTGTVTGVTGTSPIVSSGGASPAISITGATTGAAGSMSAADKTKLDGIETNATADQTASEILTLLKTVDGTGSGLDADTLDGLTSPQFLRADAADTMSGNLTVNAVLQVGNGTGNDHEVRIYKADNNVSDHIQFYNGTTRMGEIGCEDTTWLRINQETAKDIYTPRLIRADGGFQVDATTVIDGSANVIGSRVSGTVANASNADTVDNLHASSFLQSYQSDEFTGGTLTWNSATDQKIILNGSSNPYIRFREGSTDRAYLQWRNEGHFQLVNQEAGVSFKLGVNGATTSEISGNLDVTGQVVTKIGTAGSPGIAFGGADTDTGFYRDVGGNINVALNGNSIYRFRTSSFSPEVNNQDDLGTSSKKWDDVRATNGTIQTSDRNEKNTITATDLGLDFINKLTPVSYKFNEVKHVENGETDGTKKSGTRTHYGLIAQDIETLLGTIGKSATDFAGFCKDTKDDNGVDLDTPIYGLRYHEFISPIIKAIQELSTKVAALEAA